MCRSGRCAEIDGRSSSIASLSRKADDVRALYGMGDRMCQRQTLSLTLTGRSPSCCPITVYNTVISAGLIASYSLTQTQQFDLRQICWWSRRARCLQPRAWDSWIELGYLVRTDQYFRMDTLFSSGQQKHDHKPEEIQHQTLGGQQQPMKPATEAGYGVGIQGGRTHESAQTSDVRTGPMYSTDTFDSELREEDSRKQKKDRGSTNPLDDALGLVKKDDKNREEDN
ncbi:hypothetical protein Mapa_006459 [Marchantia paleacea]|nr:hypothetical protein Mapa_006459 [Marchantia paleacea]